MSEIMPWSDAFPKYILFMTFSYCYAKRELQINFFVELTNVFGARLLEVTKFDVHPRFFCKLMSARVRAGRVKG